MIFFVYNQSIFGYIARRLTAFVPFAKMRMVWHLKGDFYEGTYLL